LDGLVAIKSIRIGSSIDVVQYDDADFSSSIESVDSIKAGPPSDDNDVVRLGDMLSISLSTGIPSSYIVSMMAEITRKLNRTDANDILKHQVFSRRS
jgi:hypothetical protein